MLTTCPTQAELARAELSTLRKQAVVLQDEQVRLSERLVAQERDMVYRGKSVEETVADLKQQHEEKRVRWETSLDKATRAAKQAEEEARRAKDMLEEEAGDVVRRLRHQLDIAQQRYRQYEAENENLLQQVHVAHRCRSMF
jgi:hypothetical protein